MSNHDLIRRPLTVKTIIGYGCSAYYHEEIHGIRICVKGHAGQTAHFEIGWKQLRKSLDRKNRSLHPAKPNKTTASRNT